MMISLKFSSSIHILIFWICKFNFVDSDATSYSQNQFSCQGTTYNAAISKCPDIGAQKMSAGGNVTVFVRSANNLPNRDNTGPSAGVSDPYVRFTVGSIVKETKNIRNDLNPVWNEYVNIGVLGSATLIQVEIWDKDSGLEFSDDLLATSSVRVPFCSTFYSNYTYNDCGDAFGCTSEDSLWHMPSRQQCYESGFISFLNGQFCSDGICLQLDFYIVPFTMGVERQYKKYIQKTPQLSVLGRPSASAPWTKNFGYPYLDLPGISLNPSDFDSSLLKGALMYQMNNAEKYYGPANTIKFYGSTNFPAYIYICRPEDDNSGPPFGVGVPSWLTDSYNSRNVSVVRISLATTTAPKYGCFYQYVDGTVKNEWGGVESGGIPFRTNTVPGYDNGVSTLSYSYNYIILAVPHTVAPREESMVIVYDMAMFLSFLFSYGLIFAIFSYIIANFLSKIDYRLDRLSSYLSTRVLSGEDKCLLATLLMTYHESPSNIEYRARMFHIRNCILFVVSIPFWLLFSWGFSCSIVVRPVGLGYAVTFVGIAALTFWFGLRLWETSLWRFSLMSATSIAISIISFICFLLCTLFADPAVVQLGKNINFAALSLVFGAMNVVPLLQLVFDRDRSQQKHLAVLVNKMLDAIYYVKKKAGGKGRPESLTTYLNTNKLMHAILGETYTINPRVPAFQVAAILQEFSQQPEEPDAPKQFSKTKTDTEAYKEKEEEFKAAMQKNRHIYYISLFFLLIYFIIAATRTAHVSLAFLNIITLIFLDFIHICLSRGDISWSPGFIIALMVMGRILIMGSGPSIWVLNYSAAYTMYAILLAQEMINTYLPNLSKRQASRMVFAGESVNEITSLDVAGTALFCLGSLSLVFCAVLIVAALGSAKSALPTPFLNVLGMKDTWPTYVFGLIAILFSVNFGLLWATMRAFYLQHHGLLRGWARDGYVFRKEINTPIFLAICLEISILSSGVMIYGATKSKAVLVSSVYLPIIAVLLGYAYHTWQVNDYELVVWPRKEVEVAKQNANVSDLTVAFNMIENLFGGEESEMQLENIESGPETNIEDLKRPEKKTLKGFKLPPIKAVTDGTTDNDVKMPPLPLKSVLRRKRQNLGIKTKKPPIADLKGRENAKDSDVFGDDGDVIDAEDPWAQFELTEDDNSKSVKKEAVKIAAVKRVPFWELPQILVLRKYMAAIHGFVAPKITYCYTHCRRHAKMYPFKSVKNGEDDDDAAEKDGTVADPMQRRKSVKEMSFNTAALGGHLNQSEYTALASWYMGMFFIMLYGITLSKSVAPSYLGLLIWVSSWMFICTMIPIIKYFNTYTFDATMQTMVKFNLCFHFFFCLLFFVITLKADVGVVGTLWLFDYFMYYPLFVYIAFETYRWYDCGFKYQRMDSNNDGKISVMEFLVFIQSFPFVGFAVIIFNWQLYVWVSTLCGQTVTLMLLSCGLGYLFVRDWAVNEFYLSPELILAGRVMINLTLLITFCVALFSDSIPLFSSSIFCFTLAFKIMAKNLSRHYLLDPENTVIFFSPHVMPVYSYNSKLQDLVDESHVIKDLCKVFLVGIIWGSLLAVFYYPVNIGIALACGFLLSAAALVSIAVSSVPAKLAKAAIMLSAESIIEVAGVAKEKFYERKQPLNLESVDAVDSVVQSFEVIPDVPVVKKEKTSLEKQQERQCITIAVDIINDVRSLTYVKEEKIDSNVVDLQEEDQYDPTWYQKLIDNLKTFTKSLFESIPLNKMDGWKKHNESAFTLTDALSEAVLTGKGSFGVLGLNGFWRYFFENCKKSDHFKFLYPKFLDNYDSVGNNVKLVQLSDHIDSKGIYAQLLEYDKALDWTYKEESRCAVHFLLMMLVDANAKLNREQVLFQKFLRENRFRLASNGITPPSEIFSSESFASINIPLVAVWLSTLSPDEVERFHTLKATFSEEQKAKDELIDAADYELFIDARNLDIERSAKDKEWAELFDRHAMLQKEERYQQFANSLLGMEKQRFMQRKDMWTSDPECFVNFKEVDLYNRFKSACHISKDEVTEYIHRTLIDLETAQKDTRLGEYGRTYQFVDSTFMPNEASLGRGPANDQVLGWRCAPGISDVVDLFGGGTLPDNINEGVFGNTWLISALIMLVAAGEFGEGKVNELIMKLFVGHPSDDGELTIDTDVGAYCVQLHRNGDFIPIILDDLLPMRKKDKWTNENRGMAGAHNRECNGLWVSLVEKAFAKYFGSYAALQRGYIHHALRDLTGFETEWIPLSSASRGIGKKSLWDDLVRFKKNGYILGAGTGDSKLVDKEIQNIGIVFNSEYTIYDLVSVDGLQLLKLRNPPGDHDEWKGDWGDKSSLWTRKLRGKLNFTDANDNTYYMSFDDFCNVFRNLYVCRYYNPKRWMEEVLPGLWKKSDLKEFESNEMMNQFMEAETEGGEKLQVDNEALNRKKAKARIDSAGGLPTNQNPTCVLENNPYYSLQIHRPTDFRICVSQFSEKGHKSNFVIQPFSIFLIKNPEHVKTPIRLESLHKDDIVSYTGPPQRKKVLSLYVNSLDPGLYIVLVATSLSGMEGHFTISLLSNYRTEFVSLWPPQWLLNKEEMPTDAAKSRSFLSSSSKGPGKKQKASSSFFGSKIKSLLGGDVDDEEEEEEDGDK